jgi:hypothetical protein
MLTGKRRLVALDRYTQFAYIQNVAGAPMTVVET